MSKGETTQPGFFDGSAWLPSACSDETCGRLDQDPAIELAAELAETDQKIMQAVKELQQLRNFREMAEQSDFIAVRDEILDTLADAAGCDVYALMDGEISADTIEEVRTAMTRTKDALVMPGDRSGIAENRAITEQWMALIVYTISARLEMMKLASEFPFVARRAFEPRQIAQANPGMRMAIVQDIGRGKEGSIVLKTHENPDVRAYEDQNLLDYLLTEELALTEQMRDSLRCMALGAQALGGRICPAQKRYGLCFEVANEIDLEQFPSLEQKVTTLLAKQRQQNVNGCVGMAKTFPFEKVFDITNTSSAAEKKRPANDDMHYASKRAAKRQSRAVAAEQGDEADSHEALGNISKIVIRVKDSLLVATDIGPTESQEQLEHAIDALMATSEIREFISSHGNDSTFISFLRKALLAMIYPDNQIVNTHAIKRVRTVKGSINHDGVFEKAYRLSGNAMQGAGGGKLGKDTRILFTKALHDSTQYVTFHGIEHRASGAYNLRSFEKYF